MNDRPVIGLALGGGAALGWAHIGVIRVLQSHHITIDVISGTSIGSVVGACLAADKMSALEDIARAMTWTQMITYADVQIGKNGLLGGARVVKELTRQLGDLNIEELERPFGAVAADLISGEQVIFTQGSLIDAVRASISLPGVFTPVCKGETLLVDGGLLNTVPVSVCRDLGADFVIAINVVGDYFGQAEAAGLLDRSTEPEAINEAEPEAIDETEASLTSAGKLAATLSAWRDSAQAFFRRSSGEPGFMGVGLTAAAMIMRELARGQHAACPADIWIEPKVGHITQIEFNRADELIELGAAAAEQAMPDIISQMADFGQ